MKRPPKALILGLDGGTLEIVEPLIAEGILPCLSALLKRSAYGTTSSTWPAHTAPGWSTFVTGQPPGEHGIYQFFDAQHPNYGDRILGTPDFGCTTAWEWLAQQGYSTGLINVPMSHPPRDLPGYQVTWPLVKTLRYCNPPSFKEIRVTFGEGGVFEAQLLASDPQRLDTEARDLNGRFLVQSGLVITATAMARLSSSTT